MFTKALAPKGKTLIMLVALGLVWLFAAQQSAVVAKDQAAGVMTAYYNMLGYEGIGTLGSGLQANGQIPPVGDYVTTHCRYINVTNTTLGHYYLRYPLHLPNGANITKVSLRVADFNPSGALWVYLRSRPWNSRQAGTTLGFTLTSTSLSDQTVNISSLDVNVNNQTTEYWIDVSPQNSADPGQLCVYGIQVTYTIDGSFLPLIQRGG